MRSEKPRRLGGSITVTFRSPTAKISKKKRPVARIKEDSLDLKEASYPGNIGFSEMMKFYKIATPDQVSEMEDLLKRGDFKRAWKLLEKVAKTRMGNMNAK